MQPKYHPLNNPDQLIGGFLLLKMNHLLYFGLKSPFTIWLSHGNWLGPEWVWKFAEPKREKEAMGNTKTKQKIS